MICSGVEGRGEVAIDVFRGKSVELNVANIAPSFIRARVITDHCDFSLGCVFTENVGSSFSG